MELPQINALDFAILLLMAVVLVRGAARGTVRELFGILGVTGAYFLTANSYMLIEPGIRFVVRKTEWSVSGAYAITFIGLALVLSLLFRIVARLIKLREPYLMPDYIGGVVLGGIKGLVLVSVMVAVLPNLPGGYQEVKESWLAPRLTPVTRYFQNDIQKQSPKKREKRKNPHMPDI